MFEWMIYNVAIPLLPIPLVVFGGWLTSANIRFVSLIADGQLCFYCTGIAATAISDIIGKMKQGQAIGIDIGFNLAWLVLCIIFATYTYGVAVTSKQASNWKLGVTSIFTSVTTIIIVISTRRAAGLF